MTAKAKIYQPCKTAMQSGRRKTGYWLLEYAPAVKKSPDPLMGWNSGGTLEQISLKFDSREAAIAYADEHQIQYECFETKPRAIKPKSYSANFAFHRELPF